jgi:predicted HTH transcriptional regulator
LLADENSTSIKVAKYAGKDRDDLIENHEYGYCSLLKATDQVLDRLRVENTVKSSIGYPYRTDTPLWNERAVRELVINAIVHNDYFNEVPPKFELFSDRMEITSTGTLPDDMNQEDFFNGVSNPRNKELMRVFRDVELVESLGTGLQRVMKVYGKECFIFMDHFTRVVIPYAWLPGEENHPEKTISTQKTIQKTIQKKLTTVQKTILEYLAAHPYATQQNMAHDITIVSLGGVKYNLQVLQKNGFLRRIGPDKGGHWEIIEK